MLIYFLPNRHFCPAAARAHVHGRFGSGAARLVSANSGHCPGSCTLFHAGVGRLPVTIGIARLGSRNEAVAVKV